MQFSEEWDDILVYFRHDLMERSGFYILPGRFDCALVPDTKEELEFVPGLIFPERHNRLEV